MVTSGGGLQGVYTGVDGYQAVQGAYRVRFEKLRTHRAAIAGLNFEAAYFRARSSAFYMARYFPAYLFGWCLGRMTLHVARIGQIMKHLQKGYLWILLFTILFSLAWETLAVFGFHVEAFWPTILTAVVGDLLTWFVALFTLCDIWFL